MTPKEMKKFIDNMTYEQLLERWRFGRWDDVIFQNETGKYFAEVMTQRRKEVGEDVHTQTSKRIGWNR